MSPEIGSQILISDATLNRDLDGKIVKRMARLLVNGFSERFMVDAARAKNTTQEWERHTEPPGWELNVATEEDLSDPSLRQLLVRADIQKTSLMAALFAVNELSWWRFLWLKLRGRPIAEYKAR